jgi:hypothetical protein
VTAPADLTSCIAIVSPAAKVTVFAVPTPVVAVPLTTHVIVVAVGVAPDAPFMRVNVQLLPLPGAVSTAQRSSATVPPDGITCMTVAADPVATLASDIGRKFGFVPVALVAAPPEPPPMM